MPLQLPAKKFTKNFTELLLRLAINNYNCCRSPSMPLRTGIVRLAVCTGINRTIFGMIFVLINRWFVYSSQQIFDFKTIPMFIVIEDMYYPQYIVSNYSSNDQFYQPTKHFFSVRKNGVRAKSTKKTCKTQKKKNYL